MIIFLDLETTGLVPESDHILEIAAAAVDAQLNPVNGFSCVIRRTEQELLRCDSYVQQMHSTNGLFSEVRASPINVHAAYDGLVRWIDSCGSEKHTLAGNSIHFDLSFLRAQMPLASRRFSHRLLDVSVFRLARSVACLPECPIRAGDIHRAQGDVLASIAQARWHLSRVVA